MLGVLACLGVFSPESLYGIFIRNSHWRVHWRQLRSATDLLKSQTALGGPVFRLFREASAMQNVGSFQAGECSSGLHFKQAFEVDKPTYVQ